MFLFDKIMILIPLALAMSLIDTPGLVVPDWDYDAFTGQVGSECVLATNNQSSSKPENNSRFAFWYSLYP